LNGRDLNGHDLNDRDFNENSRLFYYFNGFNSAILEDYSGNEKIVAVADFALSRGFEFRPVSICFRNAPEHSEDILSRIGEPVVEAVFCGSSMGGWFARIMQLLLARARPGLGTVAVAFNPAFDLRVHGGVLMGPQQNHVTLERYEWTAEHDRQIRQLEGSVDYDAPLPFFVYVDKGDEMIPWDESARRHGPIAAFQAFEGGCHSFDHYHEALADFDTAFRRLKSEMDANLRNPQ